MCFAAPIARKMSSKAAVSGSAPSIWRTKPSDILRCAAARSLAIDLIFPMRAADCGGGGDWCASRALARAPAAHRCQKSGQGSLKVRYARSVCESPDCLLSIREELLKFLESRVAKWWLPDDVVFVKELPHTGQSLTLESLPTSLNNCSRLQRRASCSRRSCASSSATTSSRPTRARSRRVHGSELAILVTS